MHFRQPLFFLILFNLIANANASENQILDSQITVYDDQFYQFISPNSKIEILSDIHTWAEGPVWSKQLNALLYSDVASDTIYKWKEDEGVTTFLKPSGHAPDNSGHAWRGSNGLAIDHQGNLILAQQSNRILARLMSPLESPTPDFKTIGDNFKGDRLNSPNDVVIHRSGDLYFTDPPYGLSGLEKSEDIEMEFFGVFQLKPTGELTAIIKTIDMPNGIALSADGSQLFVSNSANNKAEIIQITLDKDGGNLKSRRFFDARYLQSEGPGSTDGLVVHATNFIFTSVPNGLAIISPTGKLLGKVVLGQVTNMAFDEHQSYLFITTPTRLLRINLVKTTE